MFVPCGRAIDSILLLCKALITPILELLADYKIIILGDREFGSVKLAYWLCQKKVKFILRVKQGRYIQENNSDYILLSDMGLLPGKSFYLSDVKVTKQKGFGSFDIAAYWLRKYREKEEDKGWYLLSNLGELKQSIDTFKSRSGIEAMFKDCKTGGYNLEKSHANNQRLNSLILLIAIAYSCAILQGQKIKNIGIQKYVGRLTECGRSIRRHSSFWIGLYGQSWVVSMEFCQDIVTELMRLRRNKLPFFQRGMRAMSLIIQRLPLL
jgi:hypothetical protein